MNEHEKWLYENTEAIASVQRGIEQASQGKGVYLGSFAQHAKCDRSECKQNNRCMDKKNCPCLPGAPTYPEATPKDLRTKDLPGWG